ncbi:MAG: OmpH family outer membrane protein [Chloroherpetonaceae bacterium]|nr:OmpH family outer membrane protein [Chthonomonadaceae bacterium]MDW8208876.1 OmpH family outer membrane protein [Chloroherpetonaceae bacterium]
MRNQRLWAVAFSLVLLVGAGTLAVRARDNTPSSPVMAMVDMNRVFQASDAPQKLAQKTAELEQQALQKLQQIDNAAFLPLPELQELIRLLARATPGPEEQTRLKQLQEMADRHARRFQMLTDRGALSDAERKELADLTARQRQMAQVLPRIREDLQADVAARVDAVRRDLYARLREVVGQVAREKGVTQVFSAEALVYSVNDLTPQVIQKLKKP